MSKAEELAKLNQLRKDGALTEEEYEKMKKEVIGGSEEQPSTHSPESASIKSKDQTSSDPLSKDKPSKKDTQQGCVILIVLGLFIAFCISYCGSDNDSSSKSTESEIESNHLKEVKGVYITKNATISMYTSDDIDNIDGNSKDVILIINTLENDISSKVAIKSFTFSDRLMQKYFNTDYMFSESYPYAEFKGVIVEDVDLTKDGEYNVNIKGELTIHKQTVQREIAASITIKNRKINVKSIFNINFEDHAVKKPTMPTSVLGKVVDVVVAEKVEITLIGELIPYKK